MTSIRRIKADLNLPTRIALIAFVVLSYVSEASASPSILPEFLQSLLPIAASVRNSQIYFSNGLHAEDSTVSMRFQTETKEIWHLSLSVHPSLQKSHEGFGKTLAPAAPSFGSFSFGDDRIVWGEEGIRGGSVLFRRGVVVVTIGGALDLNELTQLATAIDNALLHTDPALIQKEISALEKALDEPGPTRTISIADNYEARLLKPGGGYEQHKTVVFFFNLGMTQGFDKQSLPDLPPYGVFKQKPEYYAEPWRAWWLENRERLLSAIMERDNKIHTLYPFNAARSPTKLEVTK